MRLLKLIIPAALAGGMLVIYFQRQPDTVPVPQAAIKTTPHPPHAPAKLRDASKSGGSRDISAGMRKRFEETSNYAAFIQDAMLRPEEGGRFYAFVAFNRCAEIATVGANQEAELRTGQETAAKVVRGLTEKCSGVKDYFPDEPTFLQALKNANAKGSPDVLLIERGVLAPASKELASQDIRHAIASGDPYLIAATLDLNIDYLGEQLNPEFANGNERMVLYLASAAAACEIVGDCKNHYRVMAACLAGGDCAHNDYRDYLRELVAPRSRALFDKTRVALVSMARRPA